jgi:hypothetical protein
MSKNGKGSKRRVENFQLIQSNWDEINWVKKKKKTKKSLDTRTESEKLLDKYLGK